MWALHEHFLNPVEVRRGEYVVPRGLATPVTPEWLHLMGMDTLVRNGKKQTWVSGNFKTERTIVAITGKRLRLDVPLTDSYDAKVPGAGRSDRREGRTYGTDHVGWRGELQAGCASAEGHAQR